MALPAIWAYRARVERVIDGDTLDVTIDQGLHTHRTERLRLLGVNTPELKGPTRPAGLAAAGFVTDWLARVPFDDDWPLIVQTHRGDAFGRWLARVWRRTDGACLNDTLLMVGHAVPFMVD
jgi:micrococcal nuclease